MYLNKTRWLHMLCELTLCILELKQWPSNAESLYRKKEQNYVAAKSPGWVW